MNKVNHHGQRFAVNFFFAGAVKVKLQQVVGNAVNTKFAAWVHVHLNRVAIVEHAQSAFFVVRGNHHAAFNKGPANIQGRL